MIRPFGLRDVLLVRDLQRRSTILDLESVLLGEHPSLRLALTAYLLPPGMGVFTCILDAADRRGSERGFVQVRRRPGCPEWDVVYLAPALDQAEGAPTIWYRLLAGVSLIATEVGVMRVFARPARDDSTEGVLGQAGFNVYAQERVYRLDASSVAMRRRGNEWRPAGEDDREELDRLYRSGTPHLVRQAEGGYYQGGNGSLFGQLAPPGEEGYVLGAGRPEAYLGLREGARGYWIHLVLAECGSCLPAGLVSEGLGLLASRPPLPVYWAVRGYQGGIQAALESESFEPVAVRSLMVKHTTARVKVNRHKLVPGLDKGIKAAPGVSPSGEAVSRLENRA